MQTTQKKNGFASGIGFVLASAGSAVGLGNLWAFPFKASANGGAAFVFVYLACVLLIGIATMITEIYLGKRVAANPVTAFKSAHSKLGFFGLLMVMVPFLISCYYSVLGGYTLKYTVNSFGSNSGILASFSTNVLEVVLFTSLFFLLTLLIIMGGVKGGIERASKILMPALFLILVFIAIFCLCLGEGVSDGVNRFLNPDFYAFFHDAEGNLSFNGLLAAMGQSFFSLSLGMGAMVCYGSYTGKEIKIGKSVLMICLFDSIVALLAGLAMFSAIGALLPEQLGSSGGIGLMFNVLPEVFDKMGAIGHLISFLFFAMVSIAAITSVISLAEVATQFIVQKWKVARKKAAAAVVLSAFVLSIPVGISLGRVGICGEEGISLFGFDLLTFLDEATNAVLMPFCACAACVTLGWAMGEKKSLKDYFNPLYTANMLQKDGLSLGRLTPIFAVAVKYIAPLLILFLDITGIITNVGKNANYWFVIAFALLLVALAALLYFLLLYKKDTGTNADEMALEKSK